MKTLYILAISLLISDASAKGMQIAGYGAMSCSDLDQAIEENPLTQELVVTWMQGFMSGYNSAKIAAHDKYIDLSEVPFEGWAFVRNYCEGNPQSYLVAAVVDYMKTKPSAFFDQKNH